MAGCENRKMTVVTNSDESQASKRANENFMIFITQE